VTTLHGKNVES